MSNGDGFTIKEMLLQQGQEQTGFAAEMRASLSALDAKFDHFRNNILTALTVKADVVYVSKLESRIAHFEAQEPLHQQREQEFIEWKKQVESLKDDKLGKNAVSDFKKWIFRGIAVPVGLVGLDIIFQVVRIATHHG